MWCLMNHDNSEVLPVVSLSDVLLGGVSEMFVVSAFHVVAGSWNEVGFNGREANMIYAHRFHYVPVYGSRVWAVRPERAQRLR